MTPAMKVIMYTIGGLTLAGVLCVILFFAVCFDTNSQHVRAMASQIVDYELPKGYEGKYSINLFGFTVVDFDPVHEDNGHIIMVKLPSERVVSWAERTYGRTSSSYGRMRTVGREVINVRGEDIEFTMREGRNGSGRYYREISGLFTGKSGPAYLTTVGPADEETKEMHLDFIRSLR